MLWRLTCSAMFQDRVVPTVALGDDIVWIDKNTKLPLMELLYRLFTFSVFIAVFWAVGLVVFYADFEHKHVC